MAYFTSVAHELDLHKEFLARIDKVNDGDLAVESNETFSAEVLKNCGTNLGPADVEKFLRWFTGECDEAVKKKDLIGKELRELKKWRLATIHVMCPDGKVPRERSMFSTPCRR